MAPYCVMRHPAADYRGRRALAANISGDSDSVASIAGGILGARLGTRAIPAEWVARLENREYLTDLADRLAAKKGAQCCRRGACSGRPGRLMPPLPAALTNPKPVVGRVPDRRPGAGR